MSPITLAFILVAQISVCVVAVNEFILLPGDIYIGGLFAVQTNINGRCDKVDSDSVMHVEAVKWTLENLNKAQYIPGVKIGLLAFKTCGLTENTVVFTNKLLNKNRQCVDGNVPYVNGTIKIVGIIGPEFNDEAKVVSQILRLLPKPDVLPLVGFSVTSMDLDDRNAYPSFIRTVPSDAVELKVLADLLIKLDWNYIAIIHESGEYNVKYSNTIRKIITANGICVQALHQLSNDGNGVNPDEIRRILLNITIQEDSAIRGVIFIGSSNTAHAFLLVVDAMKIVDKVPMFIFQGSLAMKKSIFIDNQHSIGAAKGSILLSPVKRSVESFSKHWLQLFQNNSRLVQESYVNSWLLDLLKQISVCDAGQLQNSLCELTENTFKQIAEQSVFVSYAIEASFAMAKTIKSLHNQTCENNFGICQGFNELGPSNFFKRLQNLEYSFNDFKPFNLSYLYRTNGDDTNQKTIGNNSVYGVYNYQMMRSSSGNEFDFKQVGIFQNETLRLSRNDFKFYKTDGTEISEFQVAQCEAGKECKKCHKTTDGFYYIPGDYVVVVGISIHDKGKTPLSCSEIRPAIGLELALGAVYVINKFNEKNGIYSNTFFNKTIGVLIIDTCNEPLLISKQVLNLQESEDINSRILGFVGDIGSSPTLKFAEITGVLKYPHVGFASTTHLLDDRNKFPYFARVSMSMKQQAEGMVQMAELIGANYVQVIYSSGDYGEAGKQFIEEFVKSYGICIAQTPIEVPEGPTYYQILPLLRKKPYARVVFVILRSHVGPVAVKAISDEMEEGEFLFIGTEAWGSRSDYLKLNLKGSISFSQYIPQDPDFKRFLQLQRPQVADKNPWLLEFFQKRLNCYFPWSFDKTVLRECNDADVLTKAGTLDPWIPYVMRAVESLLFGADESLKGLCGENGGLCEDYRRNPHLVMNYIRGVRHNGMNVFNSNGNGNLGYIIYNIQKNPKNPLLLVYKQVGILTADGKLEVSKQDLANIGEPSVCPNSQACDCNKNKTASLISESEQKGYIYAIAALTVISALSMISLLVVIVMFCRSKSQGLRDSTYLTATDDKTIDVNPYHMADFTKENTPDIHPVIHSETTLQKRRENRAFTDERENTGVTI